MSKQVSLSAVFASLTMALVTLAAAHGMFVPAENALASGGAPLFEMTVTR